MDGTDRMFDAMTALMLDGEVGKTLEWRKWIEEIPYIRWPQTWEVRAIPPFAGAIIRYHVRNGYTPERMRVSVYLDCHDILGVAGEPYWEVYPGDESGDTGRCGINEIGELLDLIEVGLEYLANPTR